MKVDEGRGAVAVVDGVGGVHLAGDGMVGVRMTGMGWSTATARV